MSTDCKSGVESFKNFRNPVMLTPVPTPQTKISTFPSKSSQISKSRPFSMGFRVIFIFKLLKKNILWASGSKLTGFIDSPTPLSPGVNIILVPKASNSFLLSSFRHGYNEFVTLRSRHVRKPYPVLPLVGSTIVPPGFKRPFFSAASIIDNPIRSLTLEQGLKNSNFPITRPGSPFPKVFKERSGVLPIRSVILSATKGLLFLLTVFLNQYEVLLSFVSLLHI